MYIRLYQFSSFTFNSHLHFSSPFYLATAQSL